MSCTRPIKAQKYICETANIPAVKFKNFHGDGPNLEINCQKCLSCKLRKAKEWSLRLWHESQMHKKSCFVTLTYSDPNLPPYYDLDHRDFQLFMKRLRKNTGQKISFYMCGEYGDQTHRPHYHVILFGYKPNDLTYLRTTRGNRYYKSETLDKYWKLGFTDVTNVSYKNAGYVARYTLKKQLPKEDTQDRYCYLDLDGYQRTRKFEYVRMSTDPAIGLSWFNKHAEQVCIQDYVRDPDGHKCPVPKYYLDQLKKDGPVWYEKLATARLEKARANSITPDLLRQKEIVVQAKSKQLIRPYL